jgi:hypothetical protein
MRWLPLQDELVGLVLKYNFDGLADLRAWFDGSDPVDIYGRSQDDETLWMFIRISKFQRLTDVYILPGLGANISPTVTVSN